jgi:hypothetical protein
LHKYEKLEISHKDTKNYLADKKKRKKGKKIKKSLFHNEKGFKSNYFVF